jgi:hypothetical protein
MLLRSLQIPSFPQIDLNHSEQFLNGLLHATRTPIEQIAFYLFPSLGDFFAYHMELRQKDPSQETIISPKIKASVFQEVIQLKKAAKIERYLGIYTALSQHFSSFGGPFSISSPTLKIPYSALQSPWKEDLIKQPYHLWKESHGDHLFFLARELGKIKSPLFFFFTVSKISFVVFFYFFSPHRIIFLVISSIALHFFLEKKLQNRMDVLGVKILSKYLENEDLAKKIALEALLKIKDQNLARREYNLWCRFYVTKSGNNFLDLTHDPITKRIRRMTPKLETP